MESDLKAFEARVPELRSILAKRKSGWTLTTLAWEDVEMMLLARLWRQFHLYKPEKGPLENWSNRVISNEISNILRNNLYKFQRPCLASGPSGGLCAFNEGGDRCGFTSNGTQCNLCPLYLKWERKKQSLYNIKASLPIDFHVQEVHNLQEDFLDIEASKEIIDEKIIEQLDKHEAKIYVLLFIKNKSIEEVGKIMKYKRQGPNKIAGYQVLKKLIAKFKEMARDVISREGL